MTIGPFDNKTSLAHPGGERAGLSGRSGNAIAAAACALVVLPATASSLAGPGEAAFDPAKVERMSQAIREGRFQPDAKAIAHKLMANIAESLVSRLN
jgi:negative regulator of flagellin synthesis FlgM